MYETNLYQFAVLAERLEGAAPGMTALNSAITYTLKNHAERSDNKEVQMQVGRDEIFAHSAAVVAQGSPQLLQHLRGSIDPDSGYEILALSHAIPVVARSQGVEAALVLLGELQKLPAPPQNEQMRRFDTQPEGAFARAARGVIPLLGAQSPQRAFELAQSITEKSQRAYALASAARFQTGEVATKLWREAVNSTGIRDAPRFAAQAWQTDPKLGIELFEVARHKAETTVTQPWLSYQVWGPFAFYYAQVDAAQSRLILEREWAKVNDWQNQGPEMQAFPRMLQGQELVHGMSLIDAPRAVEMARQIPQGKGSFWSFETRLKIGQYVAATTEQRRDLSLMRWSATDAGNPEEDW